MDLSLQSKGHLGCVSSFHSYKPKTLDLILELQQHYLNVEELHKITVHCARGMTYLPYHKLPYSLMIGQIY